ncbi:hypothetical protein HYH02_015384 [Chlamydomonas schloesseri]|uniref:CDAN1-interacting nuclease 1 n=1 Tax=Chlamydomonas schloesseri TaxID=2026947 RepID=A0A835S8Y6_9CHLO|nr:hypothetical protein HYH02_015384 [Chlamydomonas schloesseri]|eukprot:KAG2422948.1 hypothetical protein HYH02_015384 [Chlamydomonas schloesseri]
MNCDDYSRVQSVLSLPYGACPAASWIRKTFPKVKEETWLAIYSQEQQYKVIRSHHLHKANVLPYLKRYGQGEDVLALAADVDFPPCMLLRRMLEQLVEGPKQLVTEVLRHPERLDAALCPGLTPDMLARMRVDVVSRRRRRRRKGH